MNERRRSERRRHRAQLAAYVFFVIVVAFLLGAYKSHNDRISALTVQMCENQVQGQEVTKRMIGLATAGPQSNPDDFPPGPVRDAVIAGRARGEDLKALVATLKPADCEKAR